MPLQTLYGKASVSLTKGETFWLSAAGLVSNPHSIHIGLGCIRAGTTPEHTTDFDIFNHYGDLSQFREGKYKWATGRLWLRVDGRFPLDSPSLGSAQVGDHLWLWLLEGVDPPLDSYTLDLVRAVGLVTA